MKRQIVTMLAGIVMLFAGSTAQAQGKAAERRSAAGTVYTASNSTAGNAVLIFARQPNGQLTPAGSVATGGTGTGAGLGNQGGVTLTADERWLLVVNAGSNSLSVFDVRPDGLRLADVIPTGGQRPISVTISHGLVYVVHANSDDITGFVLSPRGRLAPLALSTRTLSGSGVGPAQISFTPDGNFLLVTEKNTNRIDVFSVDRNGIPSGPQITDAAGLTPFGFAFGKRGQVFVTEAFGGAVDASATSSYDIGQDGTLTPISSSALTNQTAACWAAVTTNGRFAYAANTGSGSISGYSVDATGTLTLLDADGRTGVTGAGSLPIDIVVADGGRYLYNLNAGTHAIAAFRIQSDGSLVALPFATGLPTGANGLAVR